MLVSDILNSNKIETRKIAKADFLKYFLEQYKNVIRIWGLKIFIILDDRASLPADFAVFPFITFPI
jgi:hypothetical protein